MGSAKSGSHVFDGGLGHRPLGSGTLYGFRFPSPFPAIPANPQEAVIWISGGFGPCCSCRCGCEQRRRGLIGIPREPLPVSSAERWNDPRQSRCLSGQMRQEITRNSSVSFRWDQPFYGWPWPTSFPSWGTSSQLHALFSPLACNFQFQKSQGNPFVRMCAVIHVRRYCPCRPLPGSKSCRQSIQNSHRLPTVQRRGVSAT